MQYITFRLKDLNKIFIWPALGIIWTFYALSTKTLLSTKKRYLTSLIDHEVRLLSEKVLHAGTVTLKKLQYKLVWIRRFLCPSLRKKCPYSKFFWSFFSCIRIVYGERYGVSLRNRFECGKYGPEELRIRTLFTQWWTKKSSYSYQFILQLF